MLKGVGRLVHRLSVLRTSEHAFQWSYSFVDRLREEAAIALEGVEGREGKPPALLVRRSRPIDREAQRMHTWPSCLHSSPMTSRGLTVSPPRGPRRPVHSLTLFARLVRRIVKEPLRHGRVHVGARAPPGRDGILSSCARRAGGGSLPRARKGRHSAACAGRPPPP